MTLGLLQGKEIDMKTPTCTVVISALLFALYIWWTWKPYETAWINLVEAMLVSGVFGGFLGLLIWSIFFLFQILTDK